MKCLLTGGAGINIFKSAFEIKKSWSYRFQWASRWRWWIILGTLIFGVISSVHPMTVSNCVDELKL